MKYSMIAVPVFGLLYGIGVGATEEPAGATAEAPQSTGSVEITTDEEKVNYSLGFELGKDLKGQELKLLPEALLRGAEDGVSGNKALVKPTQRAAALKQIKEMRAQANLEQAQAFLAANAEKDGVETLPSGLQYRELRAGEGKTAAADNSVVVNYRGTLIDGTEFDSSYERGKPATFQVKKVIKGWREALQLMKEGAQWELFIPPELAYGKRGMRNRIPPNSALIYEVELISVK
jgi:FKBP-type peptidyl-prolyl cis-trans isomerase FklB